MRSVADLDNVHVTRYIELVMNASHNYGPDLHVFLACGPMSETYCEPVQEVIGNVTAKGVKAHFLDQRGQDTSMIWF